MEQELKKNLKSIFGFNDYRSEEQKQAVEAICSDLQDVIVCMPTSAGKSLCYQLPALSKTKSGVTVVISPLISLMTNQLTGLHKLGICAKTINSTMSDADKESVIEDLKSAQPKAKLLYITPEKATNPIFDQILKVMYNNRQLARFAVDEAHCVSEWGHDFRPEYSKLDEIHKKYHNIKWVALTATASDKVIEDVIQHLALNEPKVFKSYSSRTNLFYDVVFKDCLYDVDDNLKIFSNKALGDGWELEPPEVRGCGIIYCRNKIDCDWMSRKLSDLGLRCEPYHAGLTSEQRNEIHEQWMNGTIPVIAATISFGLGIDKATVRFVVHWSLPWSFTAYYQESGRAGRDGNKSLCRIYYSYTDRESMNYKLRGKTKKIKRENFDEMVEYCENTSCRHSAFARKIGNEKFFGKCETSCDVCCNQRGVEKKLAAFRKRDASEMEKRRKEKEKRKFKRNRRW